MKPFGITVTCLVVLVVSGCASSQTKGKRVYLDPEETLARPGRIIVYDIAATPEDIDSSAQIVGQYTLHETPQTADEVRIGRQLGQRIAAKLVDNIRQMGLSAEREDRGRPPEVGDLILSGEIISLDKGRRGRRMLIGFGAGAAELKVLVEAFQVTENGPRPVASADFRSAGGRLPGMAVPLIVVGGVVGSPITAAVVSGSLNIAQELGPERIEAAANRTAREISKTLRSAFKAHGWI